MRIAACLLVLGLLGACAFVDETVSVDYVAPANISVASGAADVTVTIAGQDRRAANWDRIANKKNGYGMDTAMIKAENDLVELTRAAVERELSSLGFKVGQGGLKVNIELQNFFTDWRAGFFSGDAVGEVVFTLTATRADGSSVYAQQYRGRGIHSVQIISGENAKKAVEMALTEAMQQLIADTALQQALVNAVKVSGTPQPTMASKTGS